VIAVVTTYNRRVLVGTLANPLAAKAHKTTGDKITKQQLRIKQNRTSIYIDKAATIPPMSTTPAHSQTEAQPMTSEFHFQGDPLLDAVMRHDSETEREDWHRKELKAIYDSHAKLMEKEHAGTVLGDGWWMNDVRPPRHTTEDRDDAKEKEQSNLVQK
jgi:hypothetical protein